MPTYLFISRDDTNPNGSLKLGSGLNRQILIKMIETCEPPLLEIARRVAPLVVDGKKVTDDPQYLVDWAQKQGSFNGSFSYLKT